MEALNPSGFIKSESAANRFARPLTGTSIGLGALATQGQTPAVPQATVTSEIHQALDVHGNFPAKITFNHQFPHLRAQSIHFYFSQLTDLAVFAHTRSSTKAARLGTAYTKDVGQ
jgi:hypothetical protein